MVSVFCWGLGSEWGSVGFMVSLFWWGLGPRLLNDESRVRGVSHTIFTHIGMLQRKLHCHKQGQSQHPHC